MHETKTDFTMKRTRTLLAFPILLTISLCSRADDNAFNRALTQLVSDCPELSILKSVNEATVSTEKALNRLSMPEVSVEHVWGSEGVGNKFDVGVSQSFDWPGLYRARAKAISAQTTANMLLEQASLVDKVTEVKALMVDIIFQKKNIKIAEMLHDHMLRLDQATRESLERGEISRLEYKRAELERIQTSMQLRENERLLTELYSELENATGRQDCVAVMNGVDDVPQWVVEPEANYEEKINTLNPRMAHLRATIEAIEATSRSEKMSASLPSFSLGYVFQREQGETFNGFNVTLGLPVYGSSNVRNASKANLLAAQLAAQSEQISILSRMRSQRRTALSLARELNDYQAIFDSDNYAELLRIALDGGETDTIHYLQELNFYIEVTRQYLELQHQYNLALVRLNCYDFPGVD